MMSNFRETCWHACDVLISEMFAVDVMRSTVKLIGPASVSSPELSLVCTLNNIPAAYQEFICRFSVKPNLESVRSRNAQPAPRNVSSVERVRLFCSQFLWFAKLSGLWLLQKMTLVSNFSFIVWQERKCYECFWKWKWKWIYLLGRSLLIEIPLVCSGSTHPFQVFESVILIHHTLEMEIEMISLNCALHMKDNGGQFGNHSTKGLFNWLLLRMNQT